MARVGPSLRIYKGLKTTACNGVRPTHKRFESFKLFLKGRVAPALCERGLGLLYYLPHSRHTSHFSILPTVYAYRDSHSSVLTIDHIHAYDNYNNCVVSFPDYVSCGKHSGNETRSIRACMRCPACSLVLIVSSPDFWLLNGC